MNLMTIMAHPDDAAIWSGGTIRTHTLRGDKCLQISLTGGKSQVLKSQFKDAAEILHSDFLIFDLESTSSPITQEIVNNITNTIVEFQPEYIFTHWKHDTHPGHVQIFDLVQQVISKSKIKLHSHSGFTTPIQVLMCDSYYSVGYDMNFQQTHLIDISNVFEEKLAAINCFSDQYLPIWQKMTDIMCQFYGGKCGCNYAEAFQAAGGLASLGGGHKGMSSLP